jgi:hypothetical protein
LIERPFQLLNWRVPMTESGADTSWQDEPEDARRFFHVWTLVPAIGQFVKIVSVCSL